MLYGFALGREYKLSVAELLAVFPKGKTASLTKDFLILENLKKEEILKKADNLGGTIKIIEINGKNILEEALESEGKFKYGISIYSQTNKDLKKILIKQKKELKLNEISSRFINKDFKNLSSAQILGENLIKRGTDFSIIEVKEKTFLGKSIWVQNINSYSKRDWQKDRDMQTGMLPPKLCQIMINISGGNIIYDPFVGLGTVLIESILIGNRHIYGSDLSEIMVNNTLNNIKSFSKENNINLEELKIIKLNAKFIEESEILLDKNIDSVITEGYLGEMMTKKNISIDRINKQKDSLSLLYSKFFQGLKKINYSGNIVMCFPFWELNSKYIYFTEIYDILEKYCEILDIVPKDSKVETTKFGSLLYKRDKQLVGREIFKLKIK